MGRRALQFFASVLMVSGVLLLSDAATTLVWQEPISAFLAGLEQRKLEDAFANPRQRVLVKQPLPGDAVGRIEMPTIGRTAYVIEGTDTGDLRKGPGHYSDTPLPGERGTVAIAGHRTTFGAPFRKLDKLEKGDEIRLQMPYGRFVYRVQRNHIVDPSEVGVKRRVAYDRLVLTACHPLYSAAERIVTFARLVRSDERSNVTKEK